MDNFLSLRSLQRKLWQSVIPFANGFSRLLRRLRMTGRGSGMMKKWLFERFLPMWAKETLWRDYRALRRENARLRRTLEQKDAYIKGMHSVLARTRKVKMDNG